VVHKSFGRLVKLRTMCLVALRALCVFGQVMPAAVPSAYRVSSWCVCLLPLAAMRVESSAMQLAGRIAGSLFMSVLVVVPLCDHASMSLVVWLCAMQ